MERLDMTWSDYIETPITDPKLSKWRKAWLYVVG